MPTENRSTELRDLYIELNPLGLDDNDLQVDGNGFEHPATSNEFIAFRAGYAAAQQAQQHHGDTTKLDMVSVPRELLQRIDHMYTEGLSIFGECEEVREILARPAQQHQGEPVVLPARRDDESCNPVYQRRAEGWNACLDELAELGPLYTHPAPADAAEVERLRAALKFYADREHYHFESGNWDTVSGEPLNILWCGDEPDFIEDGTVARNALSASAEPEAKS